MGEARNLWLGVRVMGALGLFVLFMIGCVGIGWLYWLMTGEARSEQQWKRIREDVKMTVRAPEHVVSGAPFDIQIALEHHGNRAYQLGRLVLWQRSPEQAPITCQMLSPKAQADQWNEFMLRWYWRRQFVAPGKMLTITLSCQIPGPGEYQLELSLYFKEAPLHAFIRTLQIQSKTEPP